MRAPAVSGAVPGPAFAAALGVRLREIRQAAGLSQEELAHMMGREPSFYSHLSRLEHGRFTYPSLVLVTGGFSPGACFLRANGSNSTGSLKALLPD